MSHLTENVASCFILSNRQIFLVRETKTDRERETEREGERERREQGRLPESSVSKCYSPTTCSPAYPRPALKPVLENFV